MNSYSRSCPQCNFTFAAVSDRGVCPRCQTFSRVSPNGELLSLVQKEAVGTLPNDDPFRNTPLAVVFEWLDSGGGPFTTTARYAGRPPVGEVHRQLKRRFEKLCKLLREYGLQIETETIASPANNPDWVGTTFSLAQELLVATWKTPLRRYDIVCEITEQGGAVHAVPPDATYHRIAN